MWFLDTLPEHVETNYIVESYGKGYQRTCLEILIKDSENSKHRVIIPYPYSPDKESGSFTVIDDFPDTLLQDNDSRILEDLKLYKDIRKLKREVTENSELAVKAIPTLNEMWGVYTDEDFGVVVAELENDTRYRLFYKHKISCFSSLIANTRFSGLHQLKENCEFTGEIWAVNARRDGVTDNLEFIESKRGDFGVADRYKIKGWDLDARFPTTNWESSDEETEMSEANESQEELSEANEI